MLLHLMKTRRWDMVFTLFSPPDHVQHLFYRLLDPKHPRYDTQLAIEYGNAILNIYRRMDEVLGHVMEIVGNDATLIVLSDHGFETFRKAVNLNTWLLENGYMRLKGQGRSYGLSDLFGSGQFFETVDWSQTRAYALGLGLIFINLRSREGEGIVAPGHESETLKQEIAAKLEALEDGETSERVIYRVYDGSKVYSGKRTAEAPDLVVGFNRGYRVSWQTALGGFGKSVIEPNLTKWSGDHCSVAGELIPGIILSNRKLTVVQPRLLDLPATVYDLFHIESKTEGNPILAGPP
jgi:predicted AlkP superfamily phosphohydrolase/phosphomutase